MASEQTVTLVLRMLSQSYPDRFKLGEDTLTIWHRLLVDLPDDALMAAAIDHTTHSVFPPAVAELRNACFRMVEPETPTAGEAWAKIITAVNRFGTGDVPRYGSSLPGAQTPEDYLGPMLWRCVGALGGWRYVCLSENGMADRAHFTRIYDQFVERERMASRMLPEVRQVMLQLQSGVAQQYLPEGAFELDRDANS